MKVLGTIFGIFMAGQGVRAVLNGHDVLGCLAIAAGIAMVGVAWLISAKASQTVQLVPADYIRGMSDSEVVSSWRATPLGGACPQMVAPDFWRAAVCAEMMRRKL